MNWNKSFSDLSPLKYNIGENIFSIHLSWILTSVLWTPCCVLEYEFWEWGLVILSIPFFLFVIMPAHSPFFLGREGGFQGRCEEIRYETCIELSKLGIFSYFWLWHLIFYSLLVSIMLSHCPSILVCCLHLKINLQINLVDEMQ